MMWIASHQSPTGFLARFTSPSRMEAAEVLQAAMLRSGATAGRLVEASETDFIAEIDGHWFSLSRSDSVWACAAGVSAAVPYVVPSATGSEVGADCDSSLPPTRPRDDCNLIPGAFSSVDTSVDTSIAPLLPEQRMEQIQCVKIALKGA